jgi:hypothetical protein
MNTGFGSGDTITIQYQKSGEEDSLQFSSISLLTMQEA